MTIKAPVPIPPKAALYPDVEITDIRAHYANMRGAEAWVSRVLASGIALDRPHAWMDLRESLRKALIILQVLLPKDA